jgi:4-amino-4-deoxy-L-arabinose transferase-like glycosyltransferase
LLSSLKVKTQPPILTTQHLFALMGLLLIARLSLSAFLPLMEFSEARYAEIARKMLASGDWVTLWFNDTEPFWGKPPFAFWSVAVSYLTLGVNETAARFPSLLFTLGTAAVLFWWIARRTDRNIAMVALIVYATCFLVIQTAGSVITDPAMVFFTTLVMVCFWEGIRETSRRAIYIMWICLGLGLLAKGPVAIVICGMACGLWVIVDRQWVSFFRDVRLFSGIALMLLIAAPWYYLAEVRTPGFFDYFIIGEHFERYTQSEWLGDPYGAVKDRPPGTIGLYYLFATLPWSPMVLIALCRKTSREYFREVLSQRHSLVIYLLSWALLPALFFSPAKNVLPTYVLPALPAFAILFALGCQQVRARRLFAIAATGLLVFFAGSVIIYYVEYDQHRYNQRPLVAHYLELNESNPGVLIYTGKPRFAPEFYTHGSVLFENVDTSHGMPEATFYIAVRDRWLDEQRPRLSSRCQAALGRNEFTLFYCPRTTQSSIQ